MKEEIEIPFNFEDEVKLSRYAAKNGMTRDEAIAEILSVFLSRMGF